MSYTIRINGELLFSPEAAAVDRRFALSAAELKEEENKIPSFVFNMPVFHRYRNAVTPLGDTVELADGGETLFTGRIRSLKDDYWKNAEVKCEGELGYLQDLPDEYTGAATEENPVAVQTLFAALLTGYAAKADAGRKIYAGVCDVAGSVSKAGTGQCWDTIQEWVKEFGGYLFIRHADSKSYLDYKKDRPPTDTSQAIRFGANLLEPLDRMTDAAKIETGVLAIGGTPEGASSPVTLAGYAAADVENGVLFAASRAYYGTIYKKVTFSNALTQSDLYAEATAYLTNVHAAAVSLKLAAIENKLLGLAPQHMKMSTPYMVVSAPHGLSAPFPLTNRHLNILAPENSTTEYGAAGIALTERHAGWSKQVAGVAKTAGTALQTASAAMTKADAAVPKSTKVNGHALTENVILTQADLEASDYVETLGTSGSWTYRKWHSGVAECWGTVNVSVSAGAFQAYESVYIKSFTASYPHGLFVAKPVVSKSLSTNDLSSGIYAWLGQSFSDDATAAKFVITRPANTTSDRNFGVEIYAVGRWKE